MPTRQVEKFVAATGVHNAVRLRSPPHTLQEWIASVKLASTVGLGRQESYLLKWTVRALLIAERYATGCPPRLALNPRDTVKDIMDGFPDQSGYLRKLAGGKETSKASRLIKLLKYQDSVERLSMDTCIFLSIKRSAEEIETLGAAEVRKASKSSGVSGFVHHPQVVIERLLATRE
jgi:hypothetical protein